MSQVNSNISGTIFCAIPIYNNKDTVLEVVRHCLTIMPNVVVVDDGSTDADLRVLLSGMDIALLSHEVNMGKGKAIMTASKYIEEQGGKFMITIDADGQHNPDDIKKLIPLLSEDDQSIIVGSRNFNTDNVPGKSRFGRKFANFWLRIETGVHIDDCQSGFRAYPVYYLNRLRLNSTHYDLEAEVLAKAVWAGLALKTVPVEVYYPEADRRVSNFKPFLDNLRLTHTHAMLVGRSLLPFRHKKLVRTKKPSIRFTRHPGKFLKELMKENATPSGLAMAAAVGTFLAILPLLFLHTFVILYVATRLNMNRIMAVNVQHLFMPPFVPALCIELGFYVRNGRWLTELSYETIFIQFSDRILEWFLGSLVVAPVGAMIMGFFVYFSADLIQRGYRAGR